ncbi:MAG TPA: hypothetical protein VKG45_14460 [Actinomycetes bacterium]|nr:hypothetical protein [Actinomycetes bacterium]
MHDRVGNTQTGFGHHRHGRDIGRTGRRTAPARVLAAALLLAAPGRLDAARDWLERVFWAARRLATWSDTPAPNPKLFTDLWLDAQHLGLNAQDGLLNLAKAVTQGGQHLQLARQDAARMLRDVAAIGYGFVSGVPEADGLTLPAGGDSAGRLGPVVDTAAGRFSLLAADERPSGDGPAPDPPADPTPTSAWWTTRRRRTRWSTPRRTWACSTTGHRTAAPPSDPAHAQVRQGRGRRA